MEWSDPDAEAAGVESGRRGRQRGIQSVEVGGRLLHALAHHGRPLALKDLAQAAGMPPARAHPYLVSYGLTGLVEQDPLSGHYGLGPLALQLGLMSLQQSDPLRHAREALPALVETVVHSVGIAVWGNRGPTIVHLEGGLHPVHVTMRHGTVLSLQGTATGVLFGAFMPEAEVRPLFGPHPPAEWARYQQDCREARQRGMARTEGEAIPGIHALSAAVFGARGELLLGLTAIAPASALDVHWERPVAVALRDCAARLTARLGGRPPAGTQP